MQDSFSARKYHFTLTPEMEFRFADFPSKKRSNLCKSEYLNPADSCFFLPYLPDCLLLPDFILL